MNEIAIGTKVIVPKLSLNGLVVCMKQCQKKNQSLEKEARKAETTVLFFGL